MGKKQVAVSLRNPPPADPDAFVGASIATPKRVVAEAPSVVTRVGERRELTIYLPNDLARNLSVRCLELDRDVSNVVAEALAKALNDEEPVPVTLPVDRWTRVRSFIADWRALLPLLRFA